MNARERRARVLDVLRARGLCVSTAESCTSGLLSAALTELGGSSAVFMGGVVSYWTEIKAQVLGVPRDLLEEYGAVSPQCAAAMARASRALFGSDIALSVTGVAGPDRDERGNPVGCVYLGLSDGERTMVRQPEGLGATREEIRRNAVERTLELLLEYLEGFREASESGE